MSELTEKLHDLAWNHHKGTDLGGTLQWAKLHIESLEEAARDRELELVTAMRDRSALLLLLDKASESAGQLRSMLTPDFLTDPLKTCAHDVTSHVNIMAAHGVAPYARKPRKTKGVAS